MTRIIIQNTTVLTLDDHNTFYYPGRIEIRKDKIFSIGDWLPDATPDEYEGDTTIIDGTDKLVMPGLVDLHFHTSVAKVQSPIKDCVKQTLTMVTGLRRQPTSLGISRPNLVSLNSGLNARGMPHGGLALVYHGFEVWDYDCERYVPPSGLPCECCTRDWNLGRH